MEGQPPPEQKFWLRPCGKVPVCTDTGTPSHRVCIQSSREHPANGARRVKLTSAHDRISKCHNSGGSVHPWALQVCFEASLCHRQLWGADRRSCKWLAYRRAVNTIGIIIYARFYWTRDNQSWTKGLSYRNALRKTTESEAIGLKCHKKPLIRIIQEKKQYFAFLKRA